MQKIAQGVFQDLESWQPNTTTDTDGEMNGSLWHLTFYHKECILGIRYSGIDGRRNSETGSTMVALQTNYVDINISDTYDEDINHPRDVPVVFVKLMRRWVKGGLANAIQSKKPKGKKPLNIVIIRRITMNKQMPTLSQMILGKISQRQKSNKR